MAITHEDIADSQGPSASLQFGQSKEVNQLIGATRNTNPQLNDQLTGAQQGGQQPQPQQGGGQSPPPGAPQGGQPGQPQPGGPPQPQGKGGSVVDVNKIFSDPKFVENVAWRVQLAKAAQSGKYPMLRRMAAHAMSDLVRDGNT